MPDTKLHLDATDIEWVKQLNYLGVVIDGKLTFHKHAEYITARMSKAENALKILRQITGLNCFTLRRIFNATLRAVIDYGAEVHNQMSETELRRLQRAQNAALRSCLGVPRWTPTEIQIAPVVSRSEITQTKFAENVLQNEDHLLHMYIEAQVDNPHHAAPHHKSWVAKTVAIHQKLTSAAPQQNLVERAPQIEPRVLQPNAKWENLSMSFNYNVDLPSKCTATEEELKDRAMASIEDTRPHCSTPMAV